MQEQGPLNTAAFLRLGRSAQGQNGDMGIRVRIHWIGHTTRSIPGPRLATNRSALFALRAFFRVLSFTVHGFVCEHAGRMPLTRLQSVVAWAHRSGSLLLVCHGIGIYPASEGSLFNCVAQPSVVRPHHLYTRNEADMQVRPSAKQGMRSYVTELLAL